MTTPTESAGRDKESYLGICSGFQDYFLKRRAKKSLLMHNGMAYFLKEHYFFLAFYLFVRKLETKK
jgi:hypothetical protein